MGRSFAGVLGHVGFLTSLVRGWLGGDGTQTVLFHAWLSLMAFAALGYVAGRMAEWIVEESVESKVAAEIAARDSARAAG